MSETKLMNTETKAAESLKVHSGMDSSERGSHNIASGGFPNPHQIPKFEDKYAQRRWSLEHMAGAFRVFARKGYSEGFAGHISLRDPVDPHTFWINPLGKHYALIKASDLVHVDEDGNVLPDGAQVAINTAGLQIHSALHKARPNINAACHTHSIYGKAYSAFGKELDMINQDVCIFYKSHSVYTSFNGTAVEAKEGREIAKAIGQGKAAILKNHGLLTVGSTVDEAAYLYTVMERSCQAQLLADAASAGGYKKHIIDHETAAYTEYIDGDPESLYAEFQPDFEFELAETNGNFLFKE